MKIRLLKSTLIKGRPVAPGTLVDMSESDAARLIRRKMAAQAEDGPAPKEPTFLDATAPEPPEPKRKQRR